MAVYLLSEILVVNRKPVLTDIIGGTLISAALVMMYAAFGA